MYKKNSCGSSAASSKVRYQRVLALAIKEKAKQQLE
jgi:hypothetical protein